MEYVKILAFLFYAGMMVFAVILKDDLKFNGKPVRNPLMRVIHVTLTLLIIGVVLTLFGIIAEWVGWFLMLPISSMFQKS